MLWHTNSDILLEIQVAILNDQKGPTKGEGEAIMTMYINQQKPQMVFSIMLRLPHITNDINYSFRGRICCRKCSLVEENVTESSLLINFQMQNKINTKMSIISSA